MKIVSVLVLFLNAMTAYGRPQSFGGSSRGKLGVQCKTERSGDGRYKVNCEGVNQDAIALRSEHILWLNRAPGGASVVDIEIPNYKITELIKAGYKQSPVNGPQINVLLKKPEQTHEAQVDKRIPEGEDPIVNLEYEPVTKTVVHFPNDKEYSRLSGPILPPLAERFNSGSNSASFYANDPVPVRTARQSQAVYNSNRNYNQRQLNN